MLAHVFFGVILVPFGAAHARQRIGRSPAQQTEHRFARREQLLASGVVKLFAVGVERLRGLAHFGFQRVELLFILRGGLVDLSIALLARKTLRLHQEIAAAHPRLSIKVQVRVVHQAEAGRFIDVIH